MFTTIDLHSVSHPAARAAASAVVALHCGVVVQEVSTEDIPEDAGMWLPWAAVCPCSSCMVGLIDDDWYWLSTFAAEIAALRKSGIARLRTWPGVAQAGDVYASLVLSETFAPTEALASISNSLKEEMSDPPKESELRKATAELKRIWLNAIKIMRMYDDEITELTAILEMSGSLDIDELRKWQEGVRLPKAA